MISLIRKLAPERAKAASAKPWTAELRDSNPGWIRGAARFVRSGSSMQVNTN